MPSSGPVTAWCALRLMPTSSLTTATLMDNERSTLASSPPSNSFISELDGPGTKKIKTDADEDKTIANDETPFALQASRSPTLDVASHDVDSKANSTSTPLIRVSSTTIGLKSQLKSVGTRMANNSRSKTTTPTASLSDRNDQVVPKTTTKSSKAYFKEPNVIISASTNHNGCTTKPLVINHGSSVDKITNQSEISIIPTLSSQLIFSSIITTQAKSLGTARNAISDNTTTTTTNTLQTTLSPAKTTVVLSSKQPGGSAIADSFDTNKLSKQTTSGLFPPVTPPGTHAATARLMDMGKKLLDAAREGHTEHVRQLVVNSGAPFTSDWLGTTALHLAAQHGHSEIAEILLRGGVNRDARTKLERTALHLASQSGCVEVVELLLNHGSDVNVRDMLKMTPLHWAVERGHVFVVERLLIGGADITAKSKFLLTPIDIAQNSEYYEIIDLFKRWTNKDENLGAYNNDLNDSFNESQDMLNINYHLALDDNATTSRASMLDIDEPCIDLVELELNTLKFEPEFFLSNDEEDEPKVEYLMKIVEELQKENRQLRQRVEQLSTSQ